MSIMTVDELPQSMKEILKPHELRLVVKQMNEHATEEVSDLKQLNTKLSPVLTDVRALRKSKANWGAPPPPPITCHLCKDKGYLLPKLTRENMYNRRAFACPKCKKAQRESYRERVRAEVKQNWPIKQWALELGAKPINLAYLSNRPDLSSKQKANAKMTLTSAMSLAKTFATDLPPGAILSLNGPAGTAKTHLLAKIYRYCVLKHKLACIYLRGSDLQEIFTDFKKDENNEIGLYRKKADLVACDLLLLDEVDRISIKDGFGWSENELLDIIDKRMLYNRPTALAGNWLRRLPEPVISRARSRGSYLIDMHDVPDGRPFFEGDDSWYEKAFAQIVG